MSGLRPDPLTRAQPSGRPKRFTPQAMETLDTYGHLWPDSEDATRDAVDSVLGNLAGWTRDGDVAEG